MWAYFTFLEGGSPFKRLDQQRLLDRAVCTPWTSSHAAYAGYMHDEINRYVRLQSSEPLSRGILKLSELVNIVRNSEYSSSQAIDKLARVAKNVRPERMSLPQKAGIISPEQFLKGEHLKAFQEMPSTVPHNLAPPKPTKGCFRVEPDDLVAVNHKLLESGVATLLPESLALRDSEGRIISGGLFAVDHKADSDRIILDRRPFNELERRLVWARLPHGSLLTQLIVPKGFSIRGSGDDLSNYFYLLQHNQQWLPRNAVGQCFDGEDYYEAYGGKKGESYILSFRVVAMGDLNAVDIAQQVHFEILQDGLCMQPGERIEFKQPLPASHTLEGLYIDDHIVTQILPSRKYRNKNQKFRDEVIVQQSREQYSNHGIPTSAHKAFDKQSTFVAWGTEVESRRGRVGAPRFKLQQLASLLVRVCKLPVVTRKLLQGITGLLVHPFMHRRSMMCLLQETFIWIERIKDGDRKALPTSVKEELLSCALLLPLCHTNVRWNVSCRIGASDASTTHGGRAAAIVTPPIAQTLFRFAEHKGEHVQLDWAKGQVEPPCSMHQAPEELESLLLSLPWNQTETCHFSHKQHINILETRMIQRELRDVVEKTVQPLRCVLLCDSRAAAGAWSKGRSSARNLNRLLRQSLGWTLAGRKSLHIVWVRSGANPADHPSRCRRIPEPPEVPSQIAVDVLGDNLEEYRTRRSNREIWRHVERQDSVRPAVKPNSQSVLDQQQFGDQNKKASLSSHPAAKHWSFREIFAGNAHLTKTFRHRGMFKVKPPIELMKAGKPVASHDIVDDKVFDRLCQEACQPKQLWHFGFPCGSFSIMQNMNKGTRTHKQPLGDNSLQRERDGNEILCRTLHLCDLLHAHGSFFTLENPLSSFAWKTPRMQQVAAKCSCSSIDLDQCRFGLMIPDSDGDLGLAKKPTRFLGTMPNLSRLGLRCQKDHTHVAVLGGVKVQGKWQRRSHLAGSYPQALCTAYAKAFELAFKHSFLFSPSCMVLHACLVGTAANCRC